MSAAAVTAASMTQAGAQTRPPASPAVTTPSRPVRPRRLRTGDIVGLVETALVREALAITNGNQVKASDLLGVNRATLRKKSAGE